MNKETKQLNIFLAAVAVIGITVPFMVSHTNRQVQAVQINLDNMEVTPEVYEAIATASLTCDLTDTLRLALEDEKVTYAEATDMGELCKAQALEHATQPFERGMLKQELNYIQNGGISM